MNIGIAALGLLAALLAGIVAVELQSDVARPDEAVPSRPAEAQAAAGSRASSDRSAEIATLLARPLFSGTRRPPNEAAPAVVAAPVSLAPLPRMTAIVIDGPNRSAIFAQAGGGKPVIVPEGGQLGAYTVKSINAREVVVVGPEGARTVRTTFDPNRLAPASPFVMPGGGMPNFPGPSQPVVPPVVTPGGRSPSGNTPFFLPPTGPGAGNGAAR